MIRKIFEKVFSAIFVIFIIVVIGYFIYDLYNPLKEIIINNNIDDFNNRIKEYDQYGPLKYIILGLLNAFQVFLTIMPGEPTQLLTGLICGKYWGVVICLLGIALGNTLIYLLVNFFNFEIKTKKMNKDLINNNEKKDQKSLTIFVLGLYFAPIIPYGVIAYTAAKNKMKFFRYILITTFATLPSILLCIAATTIIRNPQIFDLRELVPILIFSLLIFILVELFFKFKKKLIKHVLNRSFRATVIWAIPFIIMLTILCIFLFAKLYWSCGIMALIIITYIILYFLLSAKVSGIFTKKKMADFHNSVVIHENKFLYFLFAKVIGFFTKLKYKYKIKKNGIERLNTPSIILFNHGSAIDFMIDVAPLYPQRVNIVTAFYYFCNYHLGRLIHALGAFPKFLYQPDISSIKNIKRVLKNEGIVFLAPEGRLSPHGELESIIPSTVKLLKKECVDVYLIKNQGAYLSKPKWAKNSRKGRIDIEYIHLFTKDELKTLSLQEIYDKLYDHMYYDEYKWIEENNVTFKGKRFAEGLENILYLCPVCGHEYTISTKGNKLTCNHCHTKITLTNKYKFVSDAKEIPSTIKDWYNLQKSIERNNIQDENYILQSNVILKHPDPKGNGFKEVGQGVCTLTHDGINYKGTKNGENVDILFKLENVPALPFGANIDFEIYHDQTLYYFIPENTKSCVKWSVVEEQMYIDYMDKKGIKIIDR